MIAIAAARVAALERDLPVARLQVFREQVNPDNDVATFIGAYDSIALFSRSALRRTSALTSRIRRIRGCASAVGGLLALVVFLAAPSERGARSGDGSATWSEAPSVQSAPLLKSLALRRVVEEPRSQRRPTPHIDSPLVVDASRAEGRSRAPVAAASALLVACAAGVSARGYDATAPPSSRV